MSSEEPKLFQEPNNLEAFQTMLSKNNLVVVDFHATWCGPCKLIAPKFKTFAEEHTDIVFAKIDVDAVPDVAAHYQVRAMPTIMYFKNGEKVAEVVGANVASIKSKIEELKA